MSATSAATSSAASSSTPERSASPSRPGPGKTTLKSKDAAFLEAHNHAGEFFPETGLRSARKAALESDTPQASYPDDAGDDWILIPEVLESRQTFEYMGLAMEAAEECWKRWSEYDRTSLFGRGREAIQQMPPAMALTHILNRVLASGRSHVFTLPFSLHPADPMVDYSCWTTLEELLTNVVGMELQSAQEFIGLLVSPQGTAPGTTILVDVHDIYEFMKAKFLDLLEYRKRSELRAQKI